MSTQDEVLSMVSASMSREGRPENLDDTVLKPKLSRPRTLGWLDGETCKRDEVGVDFSALLLARRCLT